MAASVTFVSCVSDPAVYDECRRSIEALEWGSFAAVYTDAIDNAGNRYSCPQALNSGWERARTDFLVFCHQDVVFPPRWLQSLAAALAAVEARAAAPPYALLGPMGRLGKRFFGHDFDAEGRESHFGPLPAAVETLDEYCLVVSRGLPLRFDEVLGGHHLYGVDLCIQALEAGLQPYAADLPCQHKSTTRHRPPEYHAVKKKLQRKWRFGRRRVGRIIGTTCGRIRFGIFEGW